MEGELSGGEVVLRNNAGEGFRQCGGGSVAAWHGTSIAVNNHGMRAGLRYERWPDGGKGRALGFGSSPTVVEEGIRRDANAVR